MSSGAFKPLTFDAATLDEARHFNRLLALAPRFGVRHHVVPMLGQGLLRLSQVGADARLRRTGLLVEERIACMDGLRVPVRIVRPRGPVSGLVLDIHGGGWVIGNPRMNDAFNIEFARDCSVAVVSVDYRLATHAPLTALMDDCLAAARWLLGDGLPEYAGLPLVVVGESAGGQLAAAMLQRLAAWPALLARVAGTVLYYGVYDMAGSASVRAAGRATLVLDGPRMLPGLRMLTPDLDDEARRAPPMSPLFGDLSGMPPALMVVGDADPLLDDTLQLAQRWRQSAEVALVTAPDAPHGFIHFPTAMARIVRAHARAWIRDRIAVPQPA